MASTTIPNLPAVTALNGTEEIPAVQAGSNVRITIAQVAAQASAIYFGSLPTTLPAAPGIPWNNGGVICIS